MGILDMLGFGSGEQSEVEVEMEKSTQVDRFEVVKIQRDSDGTIASKETVMQEPIPISKEQAEYELGGFEPGYEYRQIAVNARGRVMSSDVVEEVVGPEALWAEKKGASQYEKELAKVKGAQGREKSKWDMIEENPKAFVAMQAIEDGDYETATELFQEDGGVETDEMEQQIEMAQKLDETGVGPETMKSAAWLQGFNLFGKVGDPEWVGKVFREATGGGVQSQPEAEPSEEPSKKEDEPAVSSTDSFEEFVEEGGGREPAPEVGAEPSPPEPEGTQEESFPDPRPASDESEDESGVDELAEEFIDEDEEAVEPPEPSGDGEAAADGNGSGEEDDVVDVSSEIGGEQE